MLQPICGKALIDTVLNKGDFFGVKQIIDFLKSCRKENRKGMLEYIRYDNPEKVYKKCTTSNIKYYCF